MRITSKVKKSDSKQKQSNILASINSLKLDHEALESEFNEHGEKLLLVTHAIDDKDKELDVAYIELEHVTGLTKKKKEQHNVVLDELEEEYHEALREVSILNDTKDEINDTIAEFNEVLDILYKNISEESAEYEAICKNYKDEIEVSKRIKDELMDGNESIGKRVVKANEELFELKKSLIFSESGLRSSLMESSNAVKEIEKSNKNIAFLKQDIADLSAKRKESKNELEKVNSELEKVKKEQQDIREQNLLLVTREDKVAAREKQIKKHFEKAGLKI